MDVGVSEVANKVESSSFDNDKPFFYDSERSDKIELPRDIYSNAEGRLGMERYPDSERSNEFDVPSGLDNLRVPAESTDGERLDKAVQCEVNIDSAPYTEVDTSPETDKPTPLDIAVESRNEGAENSERPAEIQNDSSETNDPENYDDGTRDLTDDEWQAVKEKTGWSDERRKKCTVDEDGVIHYKTDRCDLEGKTAECGVPYERKTIEYNGVIIEGVFPVFDSAFDTELPLEKYQSKEYASECNAKLKEAVQNDPELRSKFTPEQLKDIEEGRTPTGYVWHHSEEPGKMQLVKKEDHDRTVGGAAHTGGSALWGPDSTDKKVKGEMF